MNLVVYGPLRSATGTARVEVGFDGDTVEDAIAAFVQEYPRTADQLYDADGSLRPSVRVARDGVGLDPDDPCSDDDELSLVPAIRGG